MFSSKKVRQEPEWAPELSIHGKAPNAFRAQALAVLGLLKRPLWQRLPLELVCETLGFAYVPHRPARAAQECHELALACYDSDVAKIRESQESNGADFPHLLMTRTTYQGTRDGRVIHDTDVSPIQIACWDDFFLVDELLVGEETWPQSLRTEVARHMALALRLPGSIRPPERFAQGIRVVYDHYEKMRDYYYNHTDACSGIPLLAMEISRLPLGVKQAIMDSGCIQYRKSAGGDFDGAWEFRPPLRRQPAELVCEGVSLCVQEQGLPSGTLVVRSLTHSYREYRPCVYTEKYIADNISSESVQHGMSFFVHYPIRAQEYLWRVITRLRTPVIAIEESKDFAAGTLPTPKM